MMGIEKSMKIMNGTRINSYSPMKNVEFEL